MPQPGYSDHEMQRNASGAVCTSSPARLGPFCVIPWRVYFYLGLATVAFISPAIVAPFRPLPASAYMHQGEEAVRSADTQAAITAFKRAIAANPRQMDGYFSLVAAYHQAWYDGAGLPARERTQFYDEILQTYRAAAKVAPQDEQVAYGYAITLTCAEHYDARPDWAEAHAAWERCLELQQTQASLGRGLSEPAMLVTPLLYLARIELRESDPAHARNYLEAALAIAPESQMARRMLAQAQ